ncbi:C40 family peptidase [Lederbergia citrea]|uniref:C40 family peptidase n=1 Tax=Lederbergia citrea TaxID=2833581 RepID=A0A942UV98_9BACI|nr:NlpC/P60 family protein [Lederbergia citrea]MBS4205997.1 C40 family peptidase [Lederbergia citrea]MBS4224554.1 C40 family peptidase [Lederbergia citrea]
MRKHLLTTTLAITLSFNTLGIPSLDLTKVSAATTTTQNNQKAVEAKADQLIQTAKSLIGKATYSQAEYKKTAPYKFSCATFINFIFEKNGVDLATYNEDYMMEQGTHVERNQLQKGDLLFFDSRGGNIPNHVAMYIGDNKVIQMADPKQNIVITDLNSKPYYKDSYITARRVLPSLLPSNPATKGDNIVGTSYNLMNKVTMGSVNDEKAMKFTGAGFVNHVYKSNGVNLGATNIKDQMNLGTTVSRANLKKGDLIFFNSVIGSKTPTLVAIYAGDHRLIIPNSNGITTRVLFVDYYKQHYITAKRVFTEKAAPTVEQPTVKPAVKPQAPSALPADKVVKFASSLIGKAKFGYVYDEKSLTFTGAGFTYYVYKNHGIDLKYKLASQQAQVGKAVLKSNLQKGDIIFFSTDNKGSKITQTGIYLGGNEFISLSTTGPVVKQSINSVWAKNNYVTARRVL